MAKKEIIPAKQEKARERIKNFRSDLLDYRQSFERLRKDHEDSVSGSKMLCVWTYSSSTKPKLGSKARGIVQSCSGVVHIKHPRRRIHTPRVPCRTILRSLRLLNLFFPSAPPLKTTRASRTLCVSDLSWLRPTPN